MWQGQESNLFVVNEANDDINTDLNCSLTNDHIKQRNSTFFFTSRKMCISPAINCCKNTNTSPLQSTTQLQ